MAVMRIQRINMCKVLKIVPGTHNDDDDADDDVTVVVIFFLPFFN